MQGPRHLSPDSRGLPVVRLALLLAVTACGCRTTHVITADAEGHPEYEQFTIVYELVTSEVKPAVHPDEVHLEYARSHPYKAALISFQASRDKPQGTPHARLTIEYPHPASDGDMALVTVLAPADGTAEWTTIATRSLPRIELDLLFVDLVNGGLFEDEKRPYGTAQMTVAIDGHEIDRRWTREPRLDRLAVETCDESS